jgi:hypothetical protein
MYELTIPNPVRTEITKHDIQLQNWSDGIGPMPDIDAEDNDDVVRIEMHCPMSCPFCDHGDPWESCNRGHAVRGTGGLIPGPDCPGPGVYAATKIADAPEAE